MAPHEEYFYHGFLSTIFSRTALDGVLNAKVANLRGRSRPS